MSAKDEWTATENFSVLEWIDFSQLGTNLIGVGGGGGLASRASLPLYVQGLKEQNEIFFFSVTNLN